MLDVHPPHKPLHNVYEIMVHLVTITLGLLIATQIEGCMEWRSHVRLAEEARTSLRAEIAHNLEDLKGEVPVEKQWRGEIDHDLEAMSRIQNHPNDMAAQHANVALNFHSVSLRDTAWRTAEATGALAYMPYDEAQRYAEIYQDMSELEAIHKAPEEDVATMLGMIEQFNWSDKTRITADQAGQMAGKLGTMKMHLVTGQLLLERSIEACSAFLEGRQPQEDFEEHFK